MVISWGTPWENCRKMVISWGVDDSNGLVQKITGKPHDLQGKINGYQILPTKYWLVLWDMFFFSFIMFAGWWFGIVFSFPYVENFIIPTDELIFFRGMAQPPTSEEFNRGAMYGGFHEWVYPKWMVYKGKSY